MMSIEIDSIINNIKRLTKILEDEGQLLESYNLAKHIDNFEEKMLLLDDVLKLQNLFNSNKEYFEKLDKGKLKDLKETIAKFEEIKVSNNQKVNVMAESNKIIIEAIKKAAVQNIKGKSGYNITAKQVNRLFLENEMSAFTYNNRV